MKLLNRFSLFLSCLIFLISFCLVPVGDAVAKGKGNGHKHPGPPERPPGWDKGEKKGWEGEIPPGLEGKWEEEEKEKKGNDEEEGEVEKEKKEKGEAGKEKAEVEKEKGKEKEKKEK